MTSSSSSSSDSTPPAAVAAAASVPIPRAAVSVCVRCRIPSTAGTSSNSSSRANSLSSSHPPHCGYYLLVQRGQEPNRGMWSLPGGKIEFGETALGGAVRELGEETTIDLRRLRWYNGVVTTSDAIVAPNYHYLIAHCLAEYVVVDDDNDGEEDVPVARSSDSTSSSTTSSSARGMAHHLRLPKLSATDDAADINWFTRAQIEAMEEAAGATMTPPSLSSTTCCSAAVTPGVVAVIHRIEQLSYGNLLPTTLTTTAARDS
jgi:ADP-ribose pyrophosphatase YjhB (NUDIX family)